MSNLKPHVSDHIPYDLIVDIFSRVPAKSIARFRCLSKSWASILQRPYFTELFLTRSWTRPRILFTIHFDDKFLFYSSPMPQNPANDSSLVATPYHSSSLGYSGSSTCSSLYGLVCLEDWRMCEAIARVICNPITGNSITLPTMETNGYSTRSFLGYDPIGKQFKVLYMTGYNGMFHTYDEHRLITLETGKQIFWRMRKCKPHYPHFGEICINGVLYYQAKFQQSDDMIISFDVRSENFSFIKMDVNMFPHSCLTLINYKGKLGVLHYKNRQYDIVLWVLENVKEILWSQNFCVRPPLSVEIFSLSFVGMTVTGEFVFSQCYLGKGPFHVFYYNAEKNTLKKINIQGFNNQRCEEFRLYRLNSSCYIEDLKGI